MSGTAAYDSIGLGYSRARRTDPHIAGVMVQALAGARRVLDVGAGSGSYEPPEYPVVGLDPSVVMLAQRPASCGPAVLGAAEHLPFADGSFDAVMAVLTVHHWRDRAAGYAELRRVARRRVVLTYEPAVHNDMWLISDYVPEIAAIDLERVGFCVAEVADGVGAQESAVVEVPADCQDGFVMSFWNRPEEVLDPDRRAATSGFATLPPEVVTRAMDRLALDLDSGAWDARHGHLRTQPSWDCGLRLVVGVSDGGRP